MAGSRRARRATSPPTLETLGYGALWSSGRFDPGLSPHFERLLGRDRPRRRGQRHRQHLGRRARRHRAGRRRRSRTRFPGRFLLGLGASHARRGGRLHAAVLEDGRLPRCPRRARRRRCPPERRVLAALGPRMLELAAARAAGAHPYFVPVEHTARAREILGPRPAPRARGGGGPRDGPDRGPRAGPRATPASISACPTTRRTCAPSASATTTSTAAGATA